MKKNILFCLLIAFVFIFSGCLDETQESKDARTYHASFDANNVNKAYSTTVGFTLGTNLTRWKTMLGVAYRLNSGITSSNEISIGFSNGVTLNKTYNQSNYTDFYFHYIDNDGVKFYNQSNDSFEVKVKQWDGIGGYGAGTFSGKLSEDGGTRSVTITNGQFNAYIHQNF
ncbi:MAG: hypothetical protein QMC67_16155 [Candidatus Wallbacteria bacterium]